MCRDELIRRMQFDTNIDRVNTMERSYETTHTRSLPVDNFKVVAIAHNKHNPTHAALGNASKRVLLCLD